MFKRSSVEILAKSSSESDLFKVCPKESEE